MNLIVAVYAGLLFFLLTPNVLLRLPKKGSTRMVAFVHAVVFALVLFLTSKLMISLVNGVTAMFSAKNEPVKKEGFSEGVDCTTRAQCNSDEVCAADGQCVKE
jgi:hypothetical protein